MSYKRICSLFIAAALMALSPCTNTGAQDPASVDPNAIKILKGMNKYLSSLPEFTVHAENTTEEVLSSGQKLQYGSIVNLYVRRPDRFRADNTSNLRDQQLFYDGKSVTLYGKMLNYYATIDAPSTTDAALDHALESFGIRAPLADFANKSSQQYMEENLESGFYVGLSSVHGVECHHLAFRQDDIDWQIWIENSETPIPRKFIITNKLVAGAPQFTALLAEWDLAPDLSDKTFTFVPPKEAEQIKFLPAARSIDE